MAQKGRFRIHDGSKFEVVNLETIGEQVKMDDNTTAQDLKDDFNEHLAESTKKHIAESGSNTNGRYVKFDDGTMICITQRTLSSYNITVPEGGLLRGNMVNVVYPAVFVGLPSFKVIIENRSYVWETSGANPDNFMDRARFTLVSTREVTGADIKIVVSTIGRWK